MRQEAALHSPDGGGRRGRSKFASERTFAQNKRNARYSSVTENVPAVGNHEAKSASL